jgi:hypothetical protein
VVPCLLVRRLRGRRARRAVGGEDAVRLVAVGSPRVLA